MGPKGTCLPTHLRESVRWVPVENVDGLRYGYGCRPGRFPSPSLQFTSAKRCAMLDGGWWTDTANRNMHLQRWSLFLFRCCHPSSAGLSGPGVLGTHLCVSVPQQPAAMELRGGTLLQLLFSVVAAAAAAAAHVALAVLP